MNGKEADEARLYHRRLNERLPSLSLNGDILLTPLAPQSTHKHDPPRLSQHSRARSRRPDQWKFRPRGRGRSETQRRGEEVSRRERRLSQENTLSPKLSFHELIRGNVKWREERCTSSHIPDAFPLQTYLHFYIFAAISKINHLKSRTNFVLLQIWGTSPSKFAVSINFPLRYSSKCNTSWLCGNLTRIPCVICAIIVFISTKYSHVSGGTLHKTVNRTLVGRLSTDHWAKQLTFLRPRQPGTWKVRQPRRTRHNTTARLRKKQRYTKITLMNFFPLLHFLIVIETMRNLI